MAYTRAQMQQALIETALSFYYHNPYMQYDSNPMIIPMGWKIRRCDTKLTAESAAPDNWVYAVCSDYVHRVYRDAAGYLLAPSSLEYWTVSTTHVPADDPITVYKYGDDDGEQDIEKAIRESLEKMQPGDVITYYMITETAQGGHSLLYIGDYFGDGKRYILHSCAPGGGKYDHTTGVDKVEPTGTIQLQTVEEICFYPPESTIRRRDLRLANRFTIHRPLDLMEKEGFKLTPSAQTRLKYKGLEFWKTLDRSQFSQAAPGERVTVKLTVKNHSGEAYHALPISDPIPAGQPLAAVSEGGCEKDGAVCWTLDLAAGDTAELTYTIRATGKPGDLIRFPAGLVGEIPTRETALKIGVQLITPLHRQALARVNPGTFPKFLGDGKWYDLDAIPRFYYTVMGKQLTMERTVEELLSPLIEKRPVEDSSEELIVLKEGAKLPRMMLYKHMAGKYFFSGTDMNDRVLEYNEENYVPGDVFVCLTGEGESLFDPKGIELQIYLGDQRALVITEHGSSVQSFAESIGRDLRMHFVIAIRPSLLRDW